MEHLFRYPIGVAASSCLFAILKKDVPEVMIKKGKLTAKEIASETGIVDVRFLETVLRLLASKEIGLFIEHEDGTFSHTSIIEQILPFKNVLLHQLEPNNLRAWAHVEDALMDPSVYPYSSANGLSFFDHVNKDKESAKYFNESMSIHTAPLLPAILSLNYDFSKFNHIVDVGANKGVLLKGIKEKFPTISKMTLFDLPGVVPEKVEGMEIASGSFFEPETIPKDADCYVLKHIVHDWSYDKKVEILSNVRKAAKPGSTLLLIELIKPPMGHKEGSAMIHFMDTLMRVLANGSELTAQEYAELVEKSGFKHKQTYMGMVSIIESIAI